MHNVEVGNRLPNFFSHRKSIPDVGIRKYDRELLTAISCHQIGRPGCLAVDGRSDGGKASVPFLVTLHIVELFEMVHIQNDQAQGALVSHRPPPLLFQVVIEHATVGEAGQRIDPRQLFQFLIGCTTIDCRKTMRRVRTDRAVPTPRASA